MYRMSCGTAFSCGVHRFDKYKFAQHDKPANKELHDENEKKLRELMRLREQQDNGVFSTVSIPRPIERVEPQPLLHHALHPVIDHGSVLYYAVSDSKEKKD